MSNERNLPCPCGSGLKMKRCPCRDVERAHGEALEEERLRVELRAKGAVIEPGGFPNSDSGGRYSRGAFGRRSPLITAALSALLIPEPFDPAEAPPRNRRRR